MVPKGIYVFNVIGTARNVAVSRRINKFSQFYFQKYSIYSQPVLRLSNSVAVRKFATQNIPVMKVNSVEKSIYQLDSDARIKYKISIKEIEELIDAIEEKGNINYHHSLLLLRCCSSIFLNITPEKRIELLDKIKSIIENSGIQLDISHYNLILNAHIENEIPFSPNEFLKMLMEKDLLPNKVTYQRLLKAYCLQGNIAGASDILEKMKDEKLGLNEEIFNSLICGHFQVDDSKSAMAILDLMISKGIEPSSDTYVKILCGFAKIGDIQKIQEFMDECEKKDITFLNTEILEVIYTLAIHKHYKFIDTLLSKLNLSFGYKNQARPFIIRLLQKNKDSIAVKIFKATLHNDSSEGGRNHGKYMVEHFVAHRSIKDLINFCINMEKKGLISIATSYAINEVLNMEDSSKALNLFSEMKNKNLPLRSHYFWPLLIKASKEGNENIFNILTEMKNMNVRPCYLTLSKIVYPNYKFASDPLVDIDKLKTYGIDAKILTLKIFVSYILSKDFERAEKLAATKPISLKFEYLVKILVTSFFNEKNVDFFVNIIHHLINNHDKSSDDLPISLEMDDVNSLDYIQEDFLTCIFSNILEKIDETLLASVLDKMSEKNIYISSNISEMIQNKFSSEKIKELVSKLTTADSKRPERFFESVSQLNKLTQNKQISELIELCKKLPSSFSGCTLSGQDKSEYKHFLMNLAKTGNVEAVNDCFEVGKDLNLVQENKYYPLVSALVHREEYEEAVALFCEKALKTNQLAGFKAFIGKLIEIQNSVLLQKVLDTAAKIKGITYTSTIVIYQFAKLGKVKELKKLIDLKNFGITSKILQTAADRLYKENDSNGLKNLIEGCSKLNYIDLQFLYENLFEIYIKQNNYDEIQNLWLCLEEKDIFLDQIIVQKIEDFCKSVNKPTPLTFMLSKEKQSKASE